MELYGGFYSYHISYGYAVKNWLEIFNCMQILLWQRQSHQELLAFTIIFDLLMLMFTEEMIVE